MVFSGKNELTPEKRHAKVLIFRKEQTFSYFFFKNLRLKSGPKEGITFVLSPLKPKVQLVVQSAGGLWLQFQPLPAFPD